MIVHEAGQTFNGAYTNDDLTATLRSLAADGHWWLSPAVVIRMDDLKMSMTELSCCLEYGEVISFEVTPSKWEIRLRVQYLDGSDAANFQPVVWLGRNLNLFCADIRHADGPSK